MATKPKQCKFHLLDGGVVPTRGTEKSAGWDLYSADYYNLRPGDAAIIRTGVVVQPPEGFHFELILRSSMAVKHGLILANGLGLIDADYCGAKDELGVAVFRLPRERANLGSEKIAGRGIGITAETFNAAIRGKKIDVINYSSSASKRPLVINKGDRIAQLVLRPTLNVAWEEFIPAAEISRGGFGSSGK